MKGRVELVEYAVGGDQPLTDISLAEVYRKFQIKILVCAVKRGKEVYIPDGNFVVREGDRLHIAAAHQDLRTFFKSLGRKNAKVKKVIICGGGHVCFYLASQLLQVGMKVKIIERNEQRCEELCELLPKATIINGNAADQDLLMEERITDTDEIGRAHV